MRMPLTSVFRILLLSSIAAAACSDSTAPTMADVSGSYSATSFVATTPGSATNIAEGATLDLVLDANGTVTGHLFVPGSGGDADVNENMAGTWVLFGKRITFDQGADTFVRNIDWVVNGNHLVGTGTFDSVQIAVTLTR